MQRELEALAGRAADRAAAELDKAVAEPDRVAAAAFEVPAVAFGVPAVAFEVPEVVDLYFPYSSFYAFPPLGLAFKCYILGVRSHA